MTLEKVLSKFAAVARPIIRRDFRIDSCIAATAITIGVMKELGILARPYPCKVLIFNEPMVRRIRQEGRCPSPEEVIEWTTNSDLWSIGVGFTPPGQETVGHLIALVDGKYMVDASIDQASRPQKNMILPPVLVGPVTSEFRNAAKGMIVTSPDGLRLEYFPDAENLSYLKSTNWYDKSLTQPAIKNILTHL